MKLVTYQKDLSTIADDKNKWTFSKEFFYCQDGKTSQEKLIKLSMREDLLIEVKKEIKVLNSLLKGKISESLRKKYRKELKEYRRIKNVIRDGRYPSEELYNKNTKQTSTSSSQDGSGSSIQEQEIETSIPSSSEGD